MNVLTKIENWLPRMWDWVLLSILLLAGVWWVAPQQLTVVLYKSLLVSIAAAATCWVDWSLRSHFMRTAAASKKEPADIVVAAIILSRALVFLGCVLGMTMGL
jgi:hypothetical protein